MTSFSTPSPPIPHSSPPPSSIFVPPTPVTLLRLLLSLSPQLQGFLGLPGFGGCYQQRFVWDDRKYPAMSMLREIVDRIHTQVSKIEDDLKLDDGLEMIV
ncbi:hypothetical protein Q3G72_003107 [Acer saccharum]|nr:hypothetical protein Q3G72_003107 [Acer saccharum]